MKLRDLGALLRLSLLPSAISDVAAGIVFGNDGRWPAGPGPFFLLASSACVFHGALALNDWRDREHDARTRPGRPIPSGRVPAGTALAIACLLFAAGPLLALQHAREAAWVSAGLALAAVAYDLFGRGPLLGPALLAACRTGNLGLGLVLGAGSLADVPHLGARAAPLALYGLYVLRVSQLGRLEDGEQSFSRPRARGLLGSAALLLALAPFVPPFGAQGPALEGRVLAAALGWFGAAGIVRFLFRGEPRDVPGVERAMGLALRRLSVFGAVFAALSWSTERHDGLWVAAAILFGFVVAAQLRRVFPPS